MRRAGEFLDGDARVYLHAQRDVVTTALPGSEVTDLGRLTGATVSSASDGADTVAGAGRIEAWSDHHGKHELVGTGIPDQRIEVSDRDVDRMTRFDVRHLLREDVRPLLRHHRRRETLGFGPGVDFLRFLAFADDAPDAAFSDDHDEFRDGGISRQRKDVDRLDLGVEGVFVLLHDLDGRDVSGDARLDLGVLQRQRNLGLVIVTLGHETGTSRLAFVRRTRGRTLDDPQFFGGRELPEQAVASDALHHWAGIGAPRNRRQ